MQELRLSGGEVTEQNVELLVRALTLVPSVTVLVIKAGLTDSSSRKLFQLWTAGGAKALRELDLSGNGIGQDGITVRSLIFSAYDLGPVD